MRELFEYGGARMPVSVVAQREYQPPTYNITPLHFQHAIVTTHEEPKEIGLHDRPATWSNENVSGVGSAK